VNPRVSVVIPTYNRKAVLLESIASVQRQTFSDLEILVCDDGSTDGSREAVQALAAADARVRWQAGEHCGYPGTVRNRGIRAARGEWIAFQDSDDLWVGTKLEQQLALLSSAPEAQVIYSYAAALYPDGRSARMTPFRIRRNGRVFETFLLYSVVHTPTVLVRRALLQRAGGFNEDMGLTIGEDYELFLRLAAEAPFHFVAKDLVFCRTGADSVSADLFGGIDQSERVLNSVIAKYRVRDDLAREALCRIELRRYKHHLLRNFPRGVRIQDLRAALARRAASPLARILLLAETLGCARGLKWLLTARARSGA
jgi:glycosyltransferase involved in cell wall biosynthesis